MVSVIRSLHEGMSAVVAPTLFNLYFSAMVANWRARCPQAGVRVRYRTGRKLVGDRTAKLRLHLVRITKSKFADDVVVYASMREARGSMRVC